MINDIENEAGTHLKNTVEQDRGEQYFLQVCREVPRMAKLQDWLEDRTEKPSLKLESELGKKFVIVLTNLVESRKRMGVDKQSEIGRIEGLHRKLSLHTQNNSNNLEFNGIYCRTRIDKEITSAGVYQYGEIRVKNLTSVASISHEESHAMFGSWMWFLRRNPKLFAQNKALEQEVLSQYQVVTGLGQELEKIGKMTDRYEQREALGMQESQIIDSALIDAKNEIVASMTLGHDVRRHRIYVSDLKGDGHYQYIEEILKNLDGQFEQHIKKLYQAKLYESTKEIVELDAFYLDKKHVERREVTYNGSVVATVNESVWEQRRQEVRWLMTMLPMCEWKKIKETVYWQEMNQYSEFEKYLELFEVYKNGEQASLYDDALKIKDKIDKQVRNGDNVLAAITDGISQISAMTI